MFGHLEIIERYGQHLFDTLLFEWGIGDVCMCVCFVKAILY